MPVDQVAKVISNWRAAHLNDQEKAMLAFTEKFTLTPGQAGLGDNDILLIATTIAYHNYSIRMAAAFDVIPR